MIVGTVDAEGWGPSPAATIRNAGIHWARVEIGQGDAFATTSYGFSILAIVANTADATLITTLNNATQANLALTQAQNTPQAFYYEFMNEPWLKGSQAHAVKYARMYMTALTALRNAGIVQPLIYSATGSFFCETTVQTCTLVSGSPIVTMQSTDEIVQDQAISGTGIPAGSWVNSLDPDGTHWTIGNAGSPNATSSSNQSITFTGRFSNPADPSGNHGWIPRPCVTVSGLRAAILANGISLHPYGMPTEDSNGHASGIASVAWHQANLPSTLGGACPIWATEFGYKITGIAAGQTTGSEVHDEAEQATRMGEAFAALKADGINGAFYYESHDDGWGYLTSPDSSPRASFTVITSYATEINLTATSGSARAGGGDSAVFTPQTSLAVTSGFTVARGGSVVLTITARTSVTVDVVGGHTATARGGTVTPSSPNLTIPYVIVGAAAAFANGGFVSLWVPAPHDSIYRVGRERPPLRLAANIATPNGHITRWAVDERRAENVLTDLTFSSTMPGGFEACGLTLLRRPELDYQDLAAFSTLTLAGPGGQVAWQGRLNRVPRTSGDHMSVGPDLVGWQAHLDDNKTAREIYVDIDQTRWQGPSVQRQSNLSAVRDIDGPQVVTDATTGAPSLVTQFTGDWSKGRSCEAWYDARGITLNAIYFAWKLGGGVNSADSNWLWDAFLSTDDLGSTTDASGTLRAAGPGNGLVVNTASNRKFALLELFYPVAAGAAGANYQIFWTCLAVYGNHGLTGQGSDTFTSTKGFYASDIVAHAVSTWAPRLATGHAGESTIQPSTYVVPHLAFLDSTTAGEIVKQAVGFELLDWAVWPGPTFYCAPRGYYGRRWRARVGPSGLSETGADATTLFNSVTVVFRDVDGSTRTVGPTGSGADFIDDTLADSDPQNPVTLANLNKPGLLNMGIVSTPARATQTGQLFLAEQKLLNTSGQATLTGHVEDNHGVLWPAWMVRAGDYITFTDAHDTVERRIVRTSYADNGKTCSIDLDSPPDGLQELLQRLGASISPLGL